MSPHSEDVYGGLRAYFRTTVHWWPDIPERKPRWWQFRKRRVENEINDALFFVGIGPITDEMRKRYWREIRIGQCVFEDAGGYMWRCWGAALGLPFRQASHPYKDMDSVWRPGL